MNKLDKLITSFRTVQKGTQWESVFKKGQEWRGDDLSLDQPYKQSVFVYIAVHLIALNVAQAPLVWRKGDQILENVPVTNLFRYVNPYLSQFQLWEATTGFLELQGNCIWIFDQSRGQQAGISGSLPGAIYPVSISNFKPVVDGKGQLVGWIYQSKGGQIPLKPEELIHFKLWNPYDQILGLSPYEAIRLSAESDYQAQKFNRSLFKNSATPSGVLSFDKPLSDAQYDRLLKAWEQKYQGSDRAHRIALLEGGAKWQSIILTPRETEFTRGRQLSREEILGAFCVPKPLAGIFEDTNYATMRSSKKMFWQNTIQPLLKLYEDLLATNFIDRYLPNQNITATFDVSQVPELQEDMAEKVDIAKTLYDMGFTRNELNERFELGFEEVEWGDEPKPAGGASPFGLEFEVPEQKMEIESIKKGKKLPLNTVEERTSKWKELNNHLIPIQNKIRTTSKKLFEEMKDDTIKNIDSNWRKHDFTGWSVNKIREAVTKQPLDDLIYDYDVFTKKWKTSMRGSITAGVNESGTRALEMVSLDIAFDVSDPRIVHWIETRSLGLATSVNQTQVERLRTILRVGYEEGKNLDQIKNTITNYFDTMEDWEAERIARTEISYAQNYGASEAYRQSDVVEAKEWLASPDSCEECAANDGREYDLGSDEIPAHPNCRCSWLPITKEEI